MITAESALFAELISMLLLSRLMPLMNSQESNQGVPWMVLQKPNGRFESCCAVKNGVRRSRPIWINAGRPCRFYFWPLLNAA